MDRCARFPLVFLVIAALACSTEPGEHEPPSPAEAPRVYGEFPRNWHRVPPSPESRLVLPDILTAIEPPPSYPRECPEVYDDDHLPTYEVEISSSNWRLLEQEFAARAFKDDEESWVPITFKYGDEVITDAQMKLRGNNSDCRGKMQFAISFNKVRKDGRFQGMRRINLDHAGCRMFEERLSMSFARDLGLPYSCVNHARLVVNGEYYGLFVNLERQNKDFLKRHFAKAGGNLYKRDRELKTNEEENNTSDIEAYKDASDLRTISQLVDLEQAISEWAFEVVIMARDNYWWKGYNYMLYNHPERGFLFLPNDLDQAMPGNPDDGELNDVWPSSLQFPANIVLADPVWRQRFEEKLRETARAYDGAVFEQRLDKWWAQVREAALEDPFIAHDVERRWSRVREGIRIRDRHLEKWR